MANKIIKAGKRFFRFLSGVANPSYTAARHAAALQAELNRNEAIASANARLAAERVGQWREDFPEIRKTWDEAGEKPFRDVEHLRRTMYGDVAKAMAAKPSPGFGVSERKIGMAKELGIGYGGPIPAFNFYVICSNEHVAIELARLILANAIPNLYVSDFHNPFATTRATWQQKLTYALQSYSGPMKTRYRPYRVRCAREGDDYVPVKAFELDPYTLVDKP